MIAAAYGTVSDIEALWTALAVVGAAFSAWATREAIRDRRAQRASGTDGVRLTLATSAVWFEAGRFVIQMIYATIGALAMTLPEVPDSLDLPWQQVAAGALIRWGLIVSSSILTAKSIASVHFRRHALDLVGHSDFVGHRELARREQ